jgi:hypothetical protein
MCFRNGVSSSTRGGFRLSAWVISMDRVADLLLLPLRWRLNIVYFEHLPHPSEQTKERTLSVITKRQRRRQLLANSGKHATAIARQRPLYYCVWASKSKCFLTYFPYFEKKIKIGL